MWNMVVKSERTIRLPFSVGIFYPSSSLPDGEVGKKYPLRQRGSGQKGFTLLEMMIAVSIVSIVLVSVYRIHAQSLAMIEAARFHAIAPTLAQGKMAEILMKSKEDITSDSGDFGENFPDYAWKADVEDIEQTEALGELSENIKKVDLTVSYNQHEYRFRTYKYFKDQK